MIAHRLARALLVPLLLLTAACATLPGSTVSKDVAPLAADQEIPDPQLLDVTIVSFDPGELPKDEDERRGLSEDIRAAEAPFLAVHLKDTLQKSGYWGTVWVVPEAAPGAELLVTGRVVASDGESLALHITATDARGNTWLDKTYSERATKDEQAAVKMGDTDAFQDLFNTIANDLVSHRAALAPREFTIIREVAEMRYAADLAPESFGRYISVKDEKHYTLEGLPAANDPMLHRARAIRAREDMLKDTLTGYYDNFYLQLWDPYQNWRSYRADELRTMKKIKKEALTRQILGALAVIGGVAAGFDRNTSAATDTLRAVAVIGGVQAIASGFAKRKEAEINKAALEELGQSFSAEAHPLVVEVNGETVRLTGTAKEQYATWRRMLHDLHVLEEGAEADLPIIVGLDEQGAATNPAATTNSEEGHGQ